MSAYLRPVDDDANVFEIHTELRIPAFEGHEVDFARVKLSAANDLEVDAVNRIDDIVRMQVEGRVVRVDHVADEKTGKMKRVHTIKIVDAIQLPWDTEVHSREG